MTISKNDDIDLRDDIDLGPIGPLVDITDHKNIPSTNRASQGSEINDLDLGGGFDGLNINLTPMTSPQYPYNDVKETQSGHIIEINDTPGGERILIKHNSGAGIDIRPDGSIITKSNGNQININTGNSSVIVEGDVDLNYLGNVNLKIGGDLNIEVDGNTNRSFTGNVVTDIKGSKRDTVTGQLSEITKGSRSETTLQDKTIMTLSNVNEIIKGDHKHIVDGAHTSSVSGSYKISSKGELIMSSTNMNIASNDLSVFGVTGTIGGEGMAMYSKTSYANTFYGDLKGIAEFAQRADVTNSQSYSEGSTGSSAGYSITDDGHSTASPSSDLVSEYLNNSSNGIHEVTIDEGDFIKNMIDRSEANAGLSQDELNTRNVRSKLRDPNNVSNNKFITNAIQTGVLSSKYNQPIPKKLGRLSSASPSSKIPSKPFNSNESRVSRLKPNKNLSISSFVPTFKVPDTDIDGTLMLSENIRLARFLGGTGDKGLLNKVPTIQEKQNIARHYLMHAKVMKSFRTLSSFAQHRLVIVEGLYVGGPSETISENSLNDYASKGRSVVYELHDLSGEISLDKTYDLAKHWKDTEVFDELILDYDNYEPDNSLNVQIVLVMPELDSEYNFVDGNYKNKVKTCFNNKVQGNELIEILSA